MAHVMPQVKQQFFDSNGDPLSGGKVFFYQAGTSTLQATFQDRAESISNSNPVILDANGRADIWLGSAAYKVVLKDANDITLWTVDNVSITNSGAITADKLPNGFLSADATGLALMADGYLSNTTAGHAKMADNYLSANAEGRAKMQDGYLTTAKIEDAAVTTAKILDANVTTAKIADANITTAKIADSNVTTAKIADDAVTGAKLGTQYEISASSGGFTTSSSSYVDVTNLSVTITASGSRLVMVSLVADQTMGTSGLTTFTSVGPYTTGIVIQKGGVDLTLMEMGSDTAVVPPGCVALIDTPPAGSVTYKLRCKANGSGTLTGVRNCKLIAYEL